MERGCRLGRIGKIVVLLYPSTLVIFFYSSVPYFLTQFPHGWNETEVILCWQSSQSQPRNESSEEGA